MAAYKTLRRRSAARVGTLQHYYCLHSFPRVPMSLPVCGCASKVRDTSEGGRDWTPVRDVLVFGLL